MVYDGSARDAVRQFPQSINVAATLALTTIGFDAVRVTILGGPRAQGVAHRIEVHNAARSYDFGIHNAAWAANPRTSTVTAYAVLRELADLTASVVIGT